MSVYNCTRKSALAKGQDCCMELSFDWEFMLDIPLQVMYSLGEGFVQTPVSEAEEKITEGENLCYGLLNSQCIENLLV